MARIARKYVAHYIDVAAPEDGEHLFERIGTDLEEFSVSLSARVDTTKNILGETDVRISGYEKTGEVATYYADDGSELSKRLQHIIDQGKVLDDLKTYVVDVHLWGEVFDEGFPAAMEEAYIEVKSYGGDTSGYQVPYTIHYTGKRQKGYFDIENLVFIPAEDEEA